MLSLLENSIKTLHAKRQAGVIIFFVFKSIELKALYTN